MHRIGIALVAAGVAALAVGVGASATPSGTAATPTLKGTVGPAFTISLKRNGKRVTTLKAGKYRIVVADKSPFHNFELEQESGGKFERDVTAVSFAGTKTITVTLKKGKWKYYCEPHESQMFGTFRVT
jgi:plastocyanin